MNFPPSGTMSGVDAGARLSDLAVRAWSGVFDAIEQRRGNCAMSEFGRR